VIACGTATHTINMKIQRARRSLRTKRILKLLLRTPLQISFSSIIVQTSRRSGASD
jgi:hypothetical protein